MIFYNRIAQMFEWLATNHKWVLHVPDNTNEGTGNAHFGRFAEWKDAEKSSMGYPRVIMPLLHNGSMNYNYSGMHTDQKTVVVRIYDKVGEDFAHGFDGGSNCLVRCEQILEDFKRKMVDWRDNDDLMGGFADVLGRWDLERIGYREIMMDNNCWGVEATFSFSDVQDINVDFSRWQ